MSTKPRSADPDDGDEDPTEAPPPAPPAAPKPTPEPDAPTSTTVKLPT